jgi:hypothetical protein
MSTSVQIISPSPNSWPSPPSKAKATASTSSRCLGRLWPTTVGSWLSGRQKMLSTTVHGSPRPREFRTATVRDVVGCRCHVSPIRVGWHRGPALLDGLGPFVSFVGDGPLLRIGCADAYWAGSNPVGATSQEPSYCVRVSARLGTSQSSVPWEFRSGKLLGS